MTDTNTALAAPRPSYSIDADPQGIRALVADAISGAMAFGAQGVHPPPEGHWLAPFWNAARADAAPQPNAALADGWVSVDERSPKLYERVMVITTDCDDEPYATPAHYNGPGKFLGAGGVRLEPVTHWQQIDAPPVGWKLPPANPRVRHRRKPAPPTLNASKEGSHG